MKRFIQLFLFFLVIVISVIFYNHYFSKEKNIDNIDETSSDLPSIENKNNIIKNLRYDIKLNDNSEYVITSALSEIFVQNNIELVLMNKVNAKFKDKNNNTLTITSDEAEFNSSIYDTKFRKNVKVIYLDHKIYSEKLDLNLSKNNVIVYDNAIYEGLQGDIKADNMIIDLITKNIEIFMDNPKNKIIGKSN